jgi:hypothetical protein
MPVATQPSAPPPVYCTECGCEVDPAAWLCATCGKNLHEPDAMTTTCPYARATSKNSKPCRNIRERIFVILLIVALVVVYDAVIWHCHPRGDSRLPVELLFVLQSVALLFILWSDGFFYFIDF